MSSAAQQPARADAGDSTPRFLILLRPAPHTRNVGRNQNMRTTKLTREDLPWILGSLIPIAIFIISSFTENPLSNPQYGIVSVVCVFVCTMYVVIRQFGERPPRVRLTTIGAIGAASIFLFLLAISTFGMGWCKGMTLLEFLVFEKLEWVACTAELVMSYGLAASALTFILLNGVTLLYLSVRSKQAQ